MNWKRARRWGFWMLAVVVALRSFTVALPIQGQVVDSATNEPIAGANIVAAWERETGGFGGATPIGQIQILETVSDDEGRYRFPAWIKFHRPLFPFSLEFMDDMSFPKILVYKFGFAPRVSVNTTFPELGGKRRYRFLMVSWSQFNGENIDLSHVSESEPELQAKRDYLRSIESMRLTISTFASRERFRRACNWDRVSGILLAIDGTGKKLGIDGLSLDGFRPEIERCHQESLYGWASQNREFDRYEVGSVDAD